MDGTTRRWNVRLNHAKITIAVMRKRFGASKPSKGLEGFIIRDLTLGNYTAVIISSTRGNSAVG